MAEAVTSANGAGNEPWVASSTASDPQNSTRISTVIEDGQNAKVDQTQSMCSVYSSYMRHFTQHCELDFEQSL